MWTRLRHARLAAAVPGLLLSARRRALFGEMRRYCRSLPAALAAPLPAALHRLTPDRAAQADSLSEGTVRRLADLAALLERRSPLGLCLRRSLTRYHFLRRAGIPVVLRFGAKFVGGRPDREIAGHAWLTLFGSPYHESDENWRGFTEMLIYPPP